MAYDVKAWERRAQRINARYKDDPTRPNVLIKVYCCATAPTDPAHVCPEYVSDVYGRMPLAAAIMNPHLRPVEYDILRAHDLLHTFVLRRYWDQADGHPAAG